MDVRKILISLIALVVIGSSIGFGYFIAKHPAKKPDNKPSVNTASTVTTAVTVKEDISSFSQTEISFFSSEPEVTVSKEKLLIGAWTDNANFSGYEFFENGTMKVTYFNMSLINLDDVIDGTYTGTYSVDGDKLSISYTIYSKAITKNYTYKVDENTLTLKEGEDEAIYVRKGADTTMKNIDEKLLGKWSSNLSGFEFKDTGVVKITFIDLGSMGINIPISGTVDGVYSVTGDEVKIRYSIYTGVIEKTYKYKIEKDTLTLTEKGTDESGVYIRKN